MWQDVLLIVVSGTLLIGTFLLINLLFRMTASVIRWFRLHRKNLLFLLTFFILSIGLTALVLRIDAVPGSVPPNQSQPPQSQQQVSWCTRTNPHVMEPRFMRALSFIQERTNYSGSGGTTKTPVLSVFLNPIINCLNIQYCSADSMAGAEGAFLFSPGTSSQNKLSICISDRYIFQDDLLTSILLSHEIVHAIQFAIATANAGGNDNPASFCYENEAYAFTEQFMFMLSTTQGELSSLFSRMATVADLDPQVATAKYLFEMGVSPKQIQRTRECDRTFPEDSEGWFDCAYNRTKTMFEEEVRKDPYYQKQCGISGQNNT